MSDRTAQPNLSLPPTVSGGRYEIATRLGEGGMATVYRALDRKSGEWCALKVLLAKFAERPNIRARFAAEAEAMSRINHRNVIHVFDVGTGGSRPFFAMELAEGGCLVDWIETHGPMPPRMACDVAIQICKGIGAAHRQGVIHRDIKPHNILVNRRGVCKITDFGIAQFDDEAASLTQTGSVMGTLGYIAPEQRANAKDVDDRTDIYSIGATLYTLLTARTTMDLFFADQEPEMLAGVDEALVPVVMKATRYRREERYDSVRAMAKALYHAKATLPEDPPDTPSIVLKGESVEGTALRAQDTTFEPADRMLSRVPTDADDDGPTQVGARVPLGTPVPVGRGTAPPALPRGTPVPISATGGMSTATPVPRDPSLPPLRPDALEPIEHRSSTESMPPLPREALLGRTSRKKAEPLVDWGRVLRRTVAISAPLLLLLFAGSTYAGWGAALVAAERSDAYKTASIWLELLERDRHVTADIASLGGDAASLDAAWAAIDTEDDLVLKVRHAEVWLALAKKQLEANAPSSTSSSRYARARELDGRLGRLDETRSAYVKQRNEWEQATETTRGAFAVWLGLVPAPP